MKVDTAYPRNPAHLVRYMSNAVRAAVALSEGKSRILWEIDQRFADIRNSTALAALVVTEEHPVFLDLPTFIWEAWEKWDQIPVGERPEAWNDRGLDLVYDSLCEAIRGGEEFEKPLLWAGSHFSVGRGLPLDFAQTGDDVVIRKPGDAPWAGTFIRRTKMERASGVQVSFLEVLPADSDKLRMVEPAHVGLVLFNIRKRVQLRGKGM